jgi:methylmalonyl-CoA/ethylmalonyl-CoA epimerase
MKILSIEHIGIAVERIVTDSPFWELLLNNCESYYEKVVEQKVDTKIFDTTKGKIELLEATAPDSPIAKFISKRGKGLHHICFQVDDVYKAISELKDANIELIDKEPRFGTEGYLIAFVHPKSTGGVLVELAEKP